LRISSRTPARVFPGSFALRGLPPAAIPLRAAGLRRQHRLAPETPHARGDRASALHGRAPQFAVTVLRTFESGLFGSRTVRFVPEMSGFLISELKLEVKPNTVRESESIPINGDIPLLQFRDHEIVLKIEDLPLHMPGKPRSRRRDLLAG